MPTTTGQRISADWWLRGQVLFTALAAAVETAAMTRAGWQLPLTAAVFAVVGCPLVVPRADHFRTTCRVAGLLLALVCVGAFLWIFLYAVVFVTPLLIALSALLGISAPADQPTERIPVAARLELVIVGVAVALVFIETALRWTWYPTPIGLAGYGAIALLPVFFRDRLSFRVAGIVAGAGLLLVYLGQVLDLPDYLSVTAITPVPLAAGVAVVLICCGASRRTRIMGLVAAAAGCVIPLLILVTR